MKFIAVILLTLTCISGTFAQISGWKNYTDMKVVRAAAVTQSGVWGATTGGAFFYNFEDGSYRKFHKVDGLSGSAHTSIAVDKSGRIWFGSVNGRIDVLDPADYSIKAILDISNSLIQPRGVNEIVVSGDSVFVATDFGLSVIDPNNFLFIDTYSRFGSLNSNLKVTGVVKSSLIALSMENGIAVQKPGAINLSAPESWNVFTIVLRNAAVKINKIAEYDSKLIAATDSGLFYLEGTSFIPYLPDFNGVKVSDIKNAGGTLYITTNGSLYSYNGQVSQVQGIQTAVTDVSTAGEDLYISTEDGILKYSQGQVADVIRPNAPFSNLFSSLIVDNNGDLWSASGRGTTGGFYRLHNNEWRNYNTGSDPVIATNAYFNNYSTGDEIYFGSWGGGFLKIKNDNILHFNVSNTPMQGTINDPAFLVIGGIARDSRSNLWLLNYETITKQNLSMLTPDSVWYSFSIPAMQNLVLTENFGLVIDQQDTKWFYSKSTERPGVFYFNENKTYDNPADDRSGYIADALNSRAVLSLAVDTRGDLWIGTGLGVNVISNTSAALSSNPLFKPTSVFALRQQSINCIAVDPLNRKWVGTNQGLLLVNSDGSVLLESFSADDSPLLVNEIRSLTIDAESGIVYAGTDAGLTAFETAAKRPLESFEELTIYPNPLKLNNRDIPTVTIEGLIRDTDIKILNISGTVIQQFSSPGGRVAYWDGKNSAGEYVSSGVYIIVASDKDGNSVKSAKIAVMKE